MKLPLHLEKAIRRACMDEADFRRTMKIADKLAAGGTPASEIIRSLRCTLESYRESVQKDPFAVNEKT